MTPKERITRCYFGQEVDRPAVYSRTGYPANDPSYDRLKAYLAQHTELKRDWGWGIDSQYPTETLYEDYSADFRRRITILHTPNGDLRKTFLVGLANQPGLDETYFIKTRQDAEAYLSLPLPEIAGDASTFAAAQAAVGDRGIVSTSLGFNPAGFVVELFGSENFAVMSLTDRDIVHELCHRQMRIILRRFEFLLAHGAGPFFATAGEEYLVPPLHGPADFADFNVRYDKPILDRVHEAGGRVHIHCHGSIGKVIQGFVDMGTDVLHPFEPPPMGDITAAQAKAVARGKMCLEGNIEINRMYEATPDEIRAETEQLIRDAFDDHRGLIVCPSASPYIPGAGEICFPQYKAMVDTVINWRG